LLELLQHRRGALCHEWDLECVVPLVDDDLLPARERLEASLVEVSMALERAQQGRLGRCLHCGGGIDFQRLLVHPSASLCWPCQEASEQAGETRGPH
jgi:RNA polymerase-binding transcription factor DksA